MKIVAYRRVSTRRQGESGLGLEAQKAAINAYAESKHARVAGTFTEVESGKTNDRPQLAAALHLAKVTGATLVIAKLDRLSRNAAFLLTLRDSGAKLVAADIPEANDLTVGVMALVAQQERGAISQRTREALAVAKLRGIRLGNPRGAAALRRAGKGNVNACKAVRARAQRHAQDLLPVVSAIRGNGALTLQDIANELNERGMLTPRGGRWHPSSVSNLLRRIEG